MDRCSTPSARRHVGSVDHTHTVGIRLTLEPRSADDLPAGLLDDEKAVAPGIRAPALLRDIAQRLEPLRRDLPRYVEPPQSIRGGERSDLLELVRLLDQRQQLPGLVREQRQPWRVELRPLMWHRNRRILPVE